MEKVKRTPASLKKMVETFGMEILHRGSDFDSAVITISDVNRPALQLVGFYDYFDDKRLQILGRGEMRYLDRMTEAERLRVFNKLMSGMATFAEAAIHDGYLDEIRAQDSFTVDRP